MRLIFVTCLITFLLNGSAQNEVAFLKKEVPNFLTIDRELVNAPYKQISFIEKDGFILVKAKINNDQGFFILDSGAPSLVINDNNVDCNEVASGLNGDLKACDKHIDVFEWASFKKYNFDCIAVDLNHLERKLGLNILGLIGYDIIKQFETMIDYPNKLITLNFNPDQSISQNHPPKYKIPFQLKEHLPIITALIENTTASFALDSGAGTNILDETLLEKMPNHAYDILWKEELRGLDQNIILEDVIEIKNNHFNKFQLSNMTYLVTPLSFIHQTLGFKVDGLLGYDFLSDLKFSINYKDQQLYIW